MLYGPCLKMRDISRIGVVSATPHQQVLATPRRSTSMTPCLLYWSMAIIKPLPRRDVAAAQVQAGGCGLERSVWVVQGAWAGLVSQALASGRGSRDAATGEAGVVAG